MVGLHAAESLAGCRIQQHHAAVDDGTRHHGPWRGLPHGDCGNRAGERVWDVGRYLRLARPVSA